MKEENISEILGIDESSKTNSVECSTKKEESSSSALEIENASKVDTNICDSEKKQENYSDEAQNMAQPFTSKYECYSEDLQSDSTERQLIFLGVLTATLCILAGIYCFILSIQRETFEGVIMCAIIFLLAFINYAVLKVLAHISMTLKEINSKVG